MNKFSFLILFTFCISFSLFAQNKFSNKSLKLYMNASVNEDYFYTNGLEAFYLTPALVVTKVDGDFWEFEVSHMRFRDYNQTKDESRKILGANVKEIELFFSAEFNHRFFKEKYDKFRPIVGLSVSPFFQHRAFAPFDEQAFRFSSAKVGAYISVIPRLEYHFSDRWFLDVNIPMALVSSRFIIENNQNPLLLLENQTEVSFDVENFTSLGLRVGIGVIL